VTCYVFADEASDTPAVVFLLKNNGFSVTVEGRKDGCSGGWKGAEE
jgi:hypothetical protein